MTRYKVAISGSFRKHYTYIISAIEAFYRLGVVVISPKRSTIINPGEEFAILESDLTDDPFSLESAHLNAIKEADVLYIVAPDGYVGLSVAMEIGWALALLKPIFASHILADVTLRLFVNGVGSPADVMHFLDRQDLEH